MVSPPQGKSVKVGKRQRKRPGRGQNEVMKGASKRPTRGQGNTGKIPGKGR